VRDYTTQILETDGSIEDRSTGKRCNFQRQGDSVTGSPVRDMEVGDITV